MKKILISLSAIAVLFTACNQQKVSEQAHSGMEHGEAKTENVMMQAMDDSMMAMHQAKMTGNADYDFASMMIPHHEGAVAMAQEVLKNGQSEELISFSKNVIIAQQQEIAMLKDFLKTASQTPLKEAEAVKKALAASMTPMMDGMAKVKLTNDIDQDFVVLMIPHHQSAVDMAKAYLPYAKNEKIKLLAQQIIQAQEEEIKWLKTQ
ncbi:DUF305 domain-containing protein [Pedobacter cryotolerans]|uniref:DUF305 domain-containing protein n=1 Tax=Pedobacter cryotolerans TaxID=2571270 RepID=A0A4U1CFE3_9SPHI|nr:DUF305 domain-containing protein [Pedobacter cryotolerans]TKC03061.1 DUF305 domain-containing protein [Pedobacter cryotolerans]